MSVREKKKAARRQAILSVGLELMLRDGYERASVERIAAQVGIARGTFYLYFEDKSALFSTLLEQLYAPFVASLQRHAQALSQATTPAAQQLLYVQMSLDLAQHLERARPSLALHFQSARSTGVAGETARDWVRRIEDTAIAILEDARSRGVVREHDPATVGLAIVGAAERLLWAWLQGDPRLRAEKASFELARLFFEGIRPA